MLRGPAVLVAVTFIATHAFAAPAPKAVSPRARAEAREHFTAGIQAFEHGDYDGAIAEYKRAYDLAHAPALLFNLAQVYRIKGANDEALDYYRRYLREDPKAKNRADVEERIAEIEAAQRAGQAEPPPPAPAPTPTVVVPPVEPTPPPLPAPVPVPEPQVVTPEPQPDIPAPPSPAPPPPRGSGLRTAGLITLGAGGVLAATSVVLLIGAHSASSTVEDRYAKGGTWTSDDQSTYDRGKLENAIGIGTGIAAGAALAGGAILYYLGARSERVDMAYVPEAGGGRMVVTCAF